MEHKVSFSPEARDDLIKLYLFVARHANAETAIAYIERIEAFCLGLSIFPQRGLKRSERSGLRVVGFERRASIVFRVKPGQVTIQRVFYGGRDLESVLRHFRS